MVAASKFNIKPQDVPQGLNRRELLLGQGESICGVALMYANAGG